MAKHMAMVDARNVMARNMVASAALLAESIAQVNRAMATRNTAVLRMQYSMADWHATTAQTKLGTAKLHAEFVTMARAAM